MAKNIKIYTYETQGHTEELCKRELGQDSLVIRYASPFGTGSDAFSLW